MNFPLIKPYLHFLSLPEELQVEILIRTDYRSLLRCTLVSRLVIPQPILTLMVRRQVCKSLNHVIKTYSAMQYIIELGANGMEATSYTLSHVVLLQKLRDRLKAWKQLDWKRFRVIPSGDFSECRAYELVAGTFSTSNGSNLFVVWLPSASHDGRVLRHESIGLSVRDFAIDPTEDIVVFLEDDPKCVTFTILILTAHLLPIALL